MANYFITNTARFNPFTLQELANYAAQASQMEYSAEEALNALNDGSLDYYLSGEDKDSALVKQYDNLVSKIQRASEQLGDRNIPLSSIIKDISRLRGEYKKFSTPVETMGKKKQQLMDEFRKLSASNSRLIGENPGKHSLQWYIDNPDYNPVYDNGQAYLQEGEMYGKQLATQLRNPNAPYTIVPGTNGAFLRAVFRRGYSQDEIANDPMFEKIVNQVLESRGIDPNDNSPETMQRRAYIREGLFNSLGKEEIQERQNPEYLNRLQRLQAEKYQLEINALKNPPKDDYKSWFGTDDYAGKDYELATKIKNSVRDLTQENITDKNGIKFNNSLEVSQYLEGLLNIATSKQAKAYTGSSGYGYNRTTATTSNPEYQKAMEFYNKEYSRLKDYALDRADYRQIKSALGFSNNNFTYDDVYNALESNPRRFGSGQVLKYELANAENSPEQLDRYVNLISQKLVGYIGDNKNTKGQFYTTDRVNTLEPIDAKKVKDILDDNKTKIYALNGTRQLLTEEEGKPYVYLATSKGDIAIPVSFLEFAGIPLSALAQMYTAFNSSTSNFFVNDANSVGMFDDSVRESNSFNRNRTVQTISPSKGKQ